MNLFAEQSQAAGAGEHLPEREKPGPFPYSSPHTPRRPPPQADQPNRPSDSYEGPALARARGRVRNISPWLFVMATAFNTTVASILAVIITLWVVRLERSDVQPREAVLASAHVEPADGVGSEPAPANVALQRIAWSRSGHLISRCISNPGDPRRWPCRFGRKKPQTNRSFSRFPALRAERSCPARPR